MRKTYVLFAGLCLLIGFNTKADTFNSIQAVGYPGFNYKYARVGTKFYKHEYGSVYTKIGARMIVKGSFNADSGWYDSDIDPLAIEWTTRWVMALFGYYKKVQVSGNHRALLPLTGAYVSVSPTYAYC